MPSRSVREDEFLQGIYQEDIQPSLEDVETRQFKKWHKPRKQYIRIHQWCAVIRSLIRQNRMQQGDSLRYLGLPGEDLLDIRSLRGVCERDGVRVKYLGFDSTASLSKGEFELNLAQHEVSQSGFINEHSRILRARIEDIADEKSLAYRYAKQHGAFDVINIDLCNSIAGPSSMGKGPYFEAIKKLCQLQTAGRTQPWVMFAATRAGQGHFDNAIKQILLTCLTQNVKESDEFAGKLRQHLKIDDGAIRGEMSNTAPFTHSLLVQVFGLSLGKWLIQLMMNATPKIKVQLLPSYSYRVHTDEPDMLSLGFRFEPIVVPPRDRSGLTSSHASDVQIPTEAELAIEMLPTVVGIKDLDQMLLDDSELHEKMIDKCGTLLEEAHYSKDHYKKWAKTASWRPGHKPAS